MPLETATYVPDLNASNPAHTDQLAQADSHLRLLKSTLKATFPNFTSAALTSTQAQIDAVAAVMVSGQLTGNGACLPGMIADFAMTTAPTGWYLCDGGITPRTGINAPLFAAIGTTWGAGDGSTTFALPNLINRYRRHRQVGGAASIVGTLQASQNQTHTHGVSGTTSTESAIHAHGFSGTTGAMSANASHSHTYNNANVPSGGATGGGALSLPILDGVGNTSTTNTDHTHTYAGGTGAQDTNHTHTLSVTSATGSADGSEARPLSATVLTCIKF